MFDKFDVPLGCAALSSDDDGDWVKTIAMMLILGLGSTSHKNHEDEETE